MFASNFLSVVIDDNKSRDNVVKHKEDISNNNYDDLLKSLKISAKIAEILLVECTIEPLEIASKKKKPKLSFEVSVTPIYNTAPKKLKSSNEITNAQMCVEAAYSDEDSEEWVLCPICRRVFSRNCSLAIHMKSHEILEEVSKRYKCHLCPRSYSQRSVLKKHIAVHNGERETCDVCGANFSQRSSMIRHAKRVHGGRFPSTKPTLP